MSDFRNLRVWYLSRLLIIQLFDLTGGQQLNGLARSLQSTSLGIVHAISLAYAQADPQNRVDYLLAAHAQTRKLISFLSKAHELGRLEDNRYRAFCEEVKEVASMLEESVRI